MPSIHHSDRCNDLPVRLFGLASAANVSGDNARSWERAKKRSSGHLSGKRAGRRQVPPPVRREAIMGDKSPKSTRKATKQKVDAQRVIDDKKQAEATRTP